MKNHTTRIAILLVIGVITASGLAIADGNIGSVAPLGVIPQPTPQPLTVNIWTDKSSYMIGETLTIFFSVSQAAFIYIYDIQPDGIVRLVFPNAYSRRNFVSAGTHSLPDGRYKFTVAPPTGTEHLQIFASPVDLGLAPPYFGEPFPMAGSDSGSASSQIQARILGIVPEPVWATGWASFTIHQQSYGYYQPPGRFSYPPFYPPFFGSPGGTWYWENGEWHFGVPHSGWYWCFGPDGKWYFRIVFHFGGDD